jgi:hypothetical protein
MEMVFLYALGNIKHPYGYQHIPLPNAQGDIGFLNTGGYHLGRIVPQYRLVGQSGINRLIQVDDRL